MTGKSLKCAVYTRKSTEDGLEQEFNSLHAQREACEAYIKSQASEGWVLMDRAFDDGGFSGGNLDRPALKELMGLVETGRINVIVVYKIDRLTRSLADFARLVEVLDRHGASFVSVTQQFNTTTSMGRLTLNVLLSFAQFEREVTSERIRDKVAASKRRGMWMGGFPPLGYDIGDRKLAINDAESETIRTIFRLAPEAASLADLKQQLDERRIHGKCWTGQSGRVIGGKPIARASLSRLLRNPVYIGKIRQGGQLHQGEHEPILSEEDWTAVQVWLDNNGQKRRTTKRSPSDALLDGLVFDDAGNRMPPTYAQKGIATYHYYTSTPLIRASAEKAGSINRISSVRLDDEVFSSLEEAKICPPGTKPRELIATIEKIILHPAEIEIRLKDNEAGPSVLRIETDLTSVKNATRLIQYGGSNQRDEYLIRSVVQAFDWRRQLEQGRCASVPALAKAKSMSERYVAKILRLAFLAPDIVEAILDGRQPADLSLSKLNKIALTGDWIQQRKALGFLNAA